MKRLGIWLLSPYHTGSQQAWAEGYAAHSGHRVTILAMEGQFWKWRMQGGAIELVQQAERLLAAGERPAAILAGQHGQPARLPGPSATTPGRRPGRTVHAREPAYLSAAARQQA